MYNIEKDIEKIQADLEIDKASLAKVDAVQEQLEGQMKEKKKRQSVFTKEILLCEKKITKQKAELDKKVSIYCILIDLAVVKDVRDSTERSLFNSCLWFIASSHFEA